MNTEQREFAWNLYTELRKELTSLQTIRAQVIGFKITFVSAGIGLIAANLDKAPPLLFVIPGFAAIFFDLLTHSYSFSIKRTGSYIRRNLEPILRVGYAFPSERYLWEEFMASSHAGKNMSVFGNVGITILALAPAIIVLFNPWIWMVSLPLVAFLTLLFVYDIRTLFKPSEFANPLQEGYRNPGPAVAVLITKGNEILLAQRAEEPAKGKWDFVGGFVKAGESVEEAVVRETKEETGLKVGSLKYLGSLPDTYGATELPTLNLCFMAEIVEGEVRAQGDVESLSWKSSNNLPLPTGMAFKHQSEVLEWWKNNIGRQ